MQTGLPEILDSIDADSCPSQYNFHLHTLHSDGQLESENLMQQAIHLGLKGLAITDHHSVEGYRLASQWLADWTRDQPAPVLWSGVEITAQLEGAEVHILGYDFDPSAPSLIPYLQGKRVTDTPLAAATTVITALHDASGLAVLAHPARYGRSPVELITAAAELGIDGIEAYYCYRSRDPWKASPAQTALMEDLGHQFNLKLTCGTDTHGLDIRRRI